MLQLISFCYSFTNSGWAIGQNGEVRLSKVKHLEAIGQNGVLYRSQDWNEDGSMSFLKNPHLTFCFEGSGS